MSQKFAREELRKRGQFWTPEWVARAMVSFCQLDLSRRGQPTMQVFDPAFGTGAFFEAAKQISSERGYILEFSGQEIDKSLAGPSSLDQEGITLTFGDYLGKIRWQSHPNIAANPPYIRHHRLTVSQKARMRELVAKIIGGRLDGRAGLHVYFLVKSLAELMDGGRLAYILPSDIFEGVYARGLWRWISKEFRVHAVATFAPDASPFPGIDTNATVVFLSKDRPQSEYVWGRVSKPEDSEFERWVMRGFVADGAIPSQVRKLSDYMDCGLNRERHIDWKNMVPLGSLIRCMRGIATGANDFFLMTDVERRRRNLPADRFVRVVGRTRDVDGSYLEGHDLNRLDAMGRPTFCLALPSQSVEEFSKEVRKYIREGERRGLHKRALIRQRRPWYKMEVRKPPPFLFAYLGRRSARFIRNLCNTRPLTGFLCVYPREQFKGDEMLENLWALLQEKEVVDNLKLVAKSYGSGAIKVEPRALERTPVPLKLVKRHGLQAHCLSQGRLISELPEEYIAAN